MRDRWKSFLFFSAAVVCLFFAWLLVSRFSGRWERSDPSVLAGPALSLKAQKEELPRENEGERESLPSLERSETPAPEPWVVYVTGGVRNPGVYRVDAGSRVYVAVEMAGGFSPEGDAEAVNLAENLFDGRHVHVPRKGERTPAAGLPAKPSPRPVASQGSQALLDVNGATASQLATLPGIGPKLSEAIVADRDSKGFFRSVDDLTRVRGIGSAKLEAIRPFLTVGP